MAAHETPQTVCQWCNALGLSKRLSDSPAEQSQVKQCPSCESVVSKGSQPSSGGQLDTPDIVSALGLLTDQLTQLAWNGADPVPSGEESFESWRDSTMVSVIGRLDRRRKILESLRCPAVVKSYPVSHPDATSGDLIEVLEVTFGPVASTTEMLHNFHSTFQKEKEDLSVHMVRVEQGLRLLVSCGVIQSSEMDSLRIRQMRRGTLNSDPVAVTIRAYYQDTLTPGYVALMERVQ
uniref:Paraneoplastic antigen Ma-like C-terminal domain-containing protein n=1 Tax=Xenopus tropicalis TaxID=8364 RepID=A0A1B8Y898_XENTR